MAEKSINRKNPFKKALIAIATATGLVVLFLGIKYAYKAIQASMAGDKIDVVVNNARIQKLDITGIEIRANITVKNPSTTKVIFTQPYVRLLSNNSTVASSDVSSVTYDLEPLSQLDLTEISIKLPLLSLLSFLAQVNYKFPAEAVTMLKKLAYLWTQIKTLAKNLNLSLAYSTVANGFVYESTQKIVS